MSDKSELSPNDEEADVCCLGEIDLSRYVVGGQLKEEFWKDVERKPSQEECCEILDSITELSMRYTRIHTTVTREYITEHMRTPIPNSGERECSNGSKCRMLEMTNGETGPAVEFLYPGSKKLFVETGRLPSMKSFCILCIHRLNSEHLLELRSS